MGMVLAYSCLALEDQIFQAFPYILWGIVPGIIISLILSFWVTPAANSMPLQAGPDYKCPGVWG